MAAAAALYALLLWLNPLAALLLDVACLYLTLGFRQFSHSFTEIQLALAAGDLAGARATLQRWLRRDEAEEPVAEADEPAADEPADEPAAEETQAAGV